MSKKTTIKFTKDFATFKAGDEWECDGMLASKIVTKDKVANYTGESLKRHEDGLEIAKEHQKAVKDAASKRKKSTKVEEKIGTKAVKLESKRGAIEGEKEKDFKDSKKEKKSFLGFGSKK